jgi:uncharacterized protein YciI
MLFVVIFQDALERLSVRERFLPAHVEWLAQNADVIKVAGSLHQVPHLKAGFGSLRRTALNRSTP